MAGVHTWMLLGLLSLAVSPSQQQIPLEMFERLGNITDARELMEKLLMKHNDTEHDDPLFTRPGSIDPIVADIVAGSVAAGDNCSPKITSVEIPKDEDPNVCFFPNCVAMQRCGGCGCGHAMLECAPVEERITEVQVMKIRYPFPGASKFTFEGLQTTPVEEHLRCACRCKVQPHHCHHARHVYEEHSCRCKCKNDNNAISCPSHQMWSNEECACVCPKHHWCMADEFFSNDTCRCEARSSFVKIIDQQQVPMSHNSGPCKDVRCRPGYRAVPIGDICHCRISHVAGVQSGSIRGAAHMEMQPSSPVPHIDPAAEEWERVPGHPHFHHVPSTLPPPVRETLRRRAMPRRRRIGPGIPIGSSAGRK